MWARRTDFAVFRFIEKRPLGHVDFRDLGNGEFFVPGARGLKGSIGEASSKGSVALFPAGISLSCENTGFCAGLPALKFDGPINTIHNHAHRT